MSTTVTPDPVTPPGTADPARSDLVASATRRAARRLVPLLVLLYIVNYLDRVNIGFAGPNGMNAELGMTATVFGFAAGIFFVGYLLLEVPSNLMLHRFGARRWIARILLSWGILATATAFVPNAGTLIALRFLLGVAEAGFFPGIILYLTYWFPARRRARITALFLTAIPISLALGSVVSVSIINLTEGWFGLSGWRNMFLLEGLPAVALAFVTWFYLTDRPKDAAWMPAAERDALEATLADEARAASTTTPTSLRKTLLSSRVLALGWVYFGITYGLYALGFFLPTIVAGFGERFGTKFSLVEKGLITAVPFAVALGVMLLWARRGRDGRPSRHAVAVPAIVGGLAIPVTLSLGNPFLAMVAVTICACGVMCALPHFWSLPTTMLTGAAAAAGIGLINSLGNLSGFVAPYVTGLLLDLTGSNAPALWIVGACMVSAGAVVVGLRAPRRRSVEPVAEVANH